MADALAAWMGVGAVMGLVVGCGGAPERPPQGEPEKSVVVAPVASASGAATAPAPRVMERVAPEVLVKRLARIAVDKRLPEVLARANPEGVIGAPLTPVYTDAIEHATPDMIVMTTAAFSPQERTYHLYDSPVYPSYPDADVSAGGLAAFGATTAFSYAPSAVAYLLSVRVDHPPVPAKTPGLVWAVDAEAEVPSVRFVTLDGMEHEFPLEKDGPSLVPAGDWSDEWAPPVPDPAYGRAAWSVGLRTQVFPLAKVDEAFETCAEQALKKAQQSKVPGAGDSMPSGKLVKDACRTEIAAWEAEMVKNIQADVKRRTALYEMAKKRARGQSTKR